MIKRLTVMLFIVVLILSLSATEVLAQVKTYGLTGAGTLVRDGESKFCAFAGTNTPIKTVKGFRTYNQTIIKYSDGFGDGEIEEVSTYIMQEKTLGIWTLYASLGSGGTIQINNGKDDFDMAIKAELGADIAWKLGLAVGVEYLPISGEPDRTFIYGSIDLFR